MKQWISPSVFSFFLLVLSSLYPAKETVKLPERAKMTLSEYGFFQGAIADQQPAAGILPYDLNTPLFSDYAQKLRFVQLPEGTSATYREREVLDFPVGTVLIKTFYYPKDFRKPQKGRTLLETRLLLHEAEGWYALPYVWNDEQTEATLKVTGGTTDISWVHTDGKKRTLAYSIPNMNQCKGCHVKNQAIQPIGPSVRQLNRSYYYAEGEQNQLQKWQSVGYLDELPPPTISLAWPFGMTRPAALWTSGRGRTWTSTVPTAIVPIPRQLVWAAAQLLPNRCYRPGH